MKDLWFYDRSAQPSVVLETPVAGIVQNYHCLRVGYASHDLKQGEKIWLKPDDALHLYKLLKHQFE